nr:complement binding protein [Macacine gammaherpesvirus 5]WUF06299.1 complement binding protein [synthetic construct]WUF06378.1 complement binding protein [synthetic construct]WUF06458.1 complement binding protein [synthetic construct]WVG99606.1 complement binding protein [Macaca mulatta rhadinovirus]
MTFKLFPLFLLHAIMYVHCDENCKPPHFTEYRVKSNTEKDLYSVGETAELICRPGYVTNTKIITTECLQNGTWSTPNFPCDRKRCPTPADLLNGAVHIHGGDNALKFGSNISYECNEGYDLIGSNVRFCILQDTENVNWDSNEPVCEIQKCIKPPAVEHGDYLPNQDVYNYGDAITFKCSLSYTLVGSTLVCTSNKKWSNSFPTCLMLVCESPQIDNGYIDIGLSRRYNHGQSITVKCSDGYNIVGPETLTCTNTTWVPPLPKCVLVTNNPSTPMPETPMPETPTPDYQKINLSTAKTATTPNAFVTTVVSPEKDDVTCVKPHFERFMVKAENDKEKYSVGASVELICRPGFTKMQSTVSVECLSNGTWTAPNAKCHRKKCPTPQELLNGEYIVTSGEDAFKYGTNITYKCNEGYQLLGSMVRICMLKDDLKTVDWEPKAPICDIEKCKPPPQITNGKYHPVKDFYQYLDTVTFSCNRDFSLVGDEMTTCISNTWNKPFPRCEQITCSAPNIAHGKLLTGSSSVYKYGQSVTIGCETGFTLIGSEISTCKDSSWDPPLPTCVPAVSMPSDTPKPETKKPNTPTPEAPKPNTPNVGTHTPFKPPPQNPPIAPPMSKWKRHVVLVLFASVASLLFVLAALYCCFLK